MAKRRIETNFTPEDGSEGELSVDFLSDDEIYPELLELAEAYEGGEGDLSLVDTWHVVPAGDDREHDVSPRVCWCDPLVEPEGDGLLIVHNSADGREDYENGTRKMN